MQLLFEWSSTSRVYIVDNIVARSTKHRNVDKVALLTNMDPWRPTPECRVYIGGSNSNPVSLSWHTVQNTSSTGDRVCPGDQTYMDFSMKLIQFVIFSICTRYMTSDLLEL